MAKELKGINIHIGGNTVGLDKSLEKVNAKCTTLQKELKTVDDGLKLSPNNLTLVKQKQDVLSESILNTSEKLKGLLDAQKEVDTESKKGNIGAEQYREFQREIIITKSKLESLKDEQKSINGIGNDFDGVKNKVGALTNKLPSLSSAFENVNAKCDTLQNELKDVNKGLKLNPNNLTLVKQKQDILTDSISSTSEKLKGLLNSQKEVKAQAKKGDIGTEEYRKFQREIVITKSKLESLKDEKKSISVIGSAFDAVKNKVSALTNKLPSLSSALVKTGQAGKIGMQASLGAIKTTGKAFKIYSGAVATAGIAISGSTIKMASDLTEVQNVVDTTFGKNSGKIDVWAKNASTAFGMSELDAKKFNGTMGAMVKSMGIPAEKTFEMSTNLTGLSGDFASFYNLPHEEAFNKIRAGISGETEPLKQLGINMSVANLEHFAMTQGLNKSFKTMTQAEQATLRYNYILKAGKDAQGDFSKTSGGLANQMRIAKLQITNVGSSIGTSLIPSLTSFVKTVTSNLPNVGTALSNIFSGVDKSGAGLATSLTNIVTSAMTMLVNNLPNFIIVINTFLASLVNSIITVLPTLFNTVLPSLLFGFTTLITMLVAQFPTILPILVNGAITLFMGLLSAASTVITMIIQQLPTMLPQIWESSFTMFLGLINGLNQVVPILMAKLPQIIQNLCATITQNLPLIIKGGIQLIIGLITGISNSVPTLITCIINLIPVIVDALMDNLPALVSAGINLIIALSSGLIKAIPQLVMKIPQIVSSIVGGLMQTVEKIKNVGKNIIEGFWNGISNAKDWLFNKISGFFDGVVSNIKSFFGIHSPSTLFRDEIGKYLAQGIGVGFSEEIGAVNKEMEKKLPTSFDIETSVNVGKPKMPSQSHLIQNLNEQIGQFLTATQNLNVNVSLSADDNGIVKYLTPKIEAEQARTGNKFFAY